MGKIWKIVYEWGQFSNIVYEWGQFSIWGKYEWVMFFTWPGIWMGWVRGLQPHIRTQNHGKWPPRGIYLYTLNKIEFNELY